MKKINIFRLFLPLLFIISLINTPDFYAKDSKTVNIQLKWYHQFQFAGYYAAKIKGYFKDAGLNVNIIEGGPNINPMQKVWNKEADFGVSDCYLLVSRLTGTPVVVVASIFQHSPAIIMANPKRNIESLNNLEGKTIISDDSVATVFWKAFLISQNVDLSKVQVVSGKWSVKDFADNKIDAFTGYSTTEPYILSKMKAKVNVFNPNDYGVDLYGDVLFSSEDYINNNYSTTVDFRNAVLKGWEYAFENKEEIINYILTLPGVKERGVTKDELEFEADELYKLVLPNLVTIGHNNFGRWNTIAKMLVDSKLLKNPSKLDESFIFDPQKTKESKIVTIIVWLGLIIVFIVLLSLLWIKQLRKRVESRTAELKREIEQRTETEKLLVQEKIFFRNLMENIPDCIYFKDKDSKFIRINKSTAYSFGLSDTEEVLGRSDFDFFAGEHAKNAFADEQKVIETGIPIINKEEKETRADGRITWASSTKMPFFDENGNVIGTFGVSRDITDRKTAEQQVVTSEKKFKSLFEYSNDGIVLIEKGAIIEVNSKAAELYRCTREELIGLTPADISPEFQENGLRSVEEGLRKFKAAAEMGPQFFEWEQKRPDGTTFIAETSLSKIEFENKVIYQAIVRDITERKKTEEYIKKYAEVFQKTKMGIALFDHKQQTIQMLNPALAEMHGYTVEELINQPLSVLFSNECKHQVPYALNMLNEQDHYVLDFESECKDGKTFPSQVDISLVKDTAGKPLFAIINIQNISERKNAENVQKALYRISEAVNTTEDIDTLYKVIHENIKHLMKADNFYIALYDDETDMISFPYFVDEVDNVIPKKGKLGRGLTAYCIRTGQDLLVNQQLDMELRARGEVDMEGEPTKIWLGVVLKLYQKIIGVIVVQDYEDSNTYGEEEKDILIFVSEQIAYAIDKKRKEEALKKSADDLFESNANKDKFFSIIAHDLRSPFFALLAISELLTKEIDSLSKEEIENLTRELDKALKNQYKLLENLLEWARLQTGRIRYQPDNYHLYEEVNHIQDLLKANIIKKNIHFENNTDKKVDIYVDINMIHSVVQNIISNAIKFTRSGDSIVVTSDLVENAMVKVTIKDSGIGIKPADLAKLFHIDQQHSTVGTAQERGTGLGLILCKELIEKNGGTIWAESVEGKGSSFIFTVPLARVKVN